MKRAFIHIGIAATLGYIALCGWLYAAQDALLYFPTDEVHSSQAEAVTFVHRGETLKLWKVGDGPHAILYFGGNGENVAYNVPVYVGQFPGTTIYFVNYRGYGGSSGTPSEEALFVDAAFVYDELRGRHPQVSVIGRSLGSGVATWLAANRPVHRLALVTPFDSVEAVASAAYPFAPVSLLLRDKYRSVDFAPYINSPVLVLVAGTDRIVPHRHTVALVGRFRDDQVRMQTIDNTTHNTIDRSAAYLHALRDFLLDGDAGESTRAAR